MTRTNRTASKITAALLALAGVTALAAPAHAQSTEEVLGTLIGGSLGAVIGNEIDDGGTTGQVVGALVGGTVGYVVGDRIDDRNDAKRYYRQTYTQPRTYYAQPTTGYVQPAPRYTQPTYTRTYTTPRYVQPRTTYVAPRRVVAKPTYCRTDYYGRKVCTYR